MSELFAAQVSQVGKTAKLSVRSVHPDSGPVTSDATFALQLVFDPILNAGYSGFSKYKHLADSPLAQVMDLDSYLEPTWVKANARAFIAKAKVVKNVLEIWPTHPAWIEHLRKGMSWDTAAYSMGKGDAAKPRTPTAGVAEADSDPTAGFRLAKPRDKALKLGKVYLPIHSATKYMAEPAITKLPEMVKAGRTLLGQPIVVVPKRGVVEVGLLSERYKTEAIYLYKESESGYSTSSVNFTDLKSMGRARLKK